MLSQRIIPRLLDHQDVICYQGLAVRAFRNMMAQKVHMPLQFSVAHDHHVRIEYPSDLDSLFLHHSKQTDRTHYDATS